VHKGKLINWTQEMVAARNGCSKKWLQQEMVAARNGCTSDSETTVGARATARPLLVHERRSRNLSRA